jgi:chromosomal replication initiator protein
MALKNAWDSIKDELHQTLTSEAFQNWVARTTYLGTEAEQLRVGVPDPMTRFFLESEYSGKVQTAVRRLNLPYRMVVYEVDDTPRPAATPSPQTAAEPGVALSGSTLNVRLTFSNFVVGSCNQFAHAASRAVAERPAKSYNPLFIYGGTGVGKTHLLHAIGHELTGRYARMRVIYTSAERFMNEMVGCLRSDRMPQFHQYYRTTDVLLIDDVHTLAGKERTQEEFFHTFNELYDHQKQIVLSSDRLPKETSGLVDRLRSRFEWGLLVDVQAPDPETKMAILEKKAAAEGVELPQEVSAFLATKTKSNVRELEGALIKLMAYSSVTGAPISVPMAQQVLRTILAQPERRISIEAVARAVVERYSLQLSELKRKTNAHEISRPRQVAMYLARELTGASLPEIGRWFGGKHHTTVLHSIRKIESLRATDPNINKMVHSVMDSFN